MTNKKINIATIFLILIAFIACTELSNDPLNENKAPNTSIFLYPDNPDSINQQKSRLQVHWWGEDPDGVVLGYYFRWVGIDSEWNFTTRNDSVFSLPIGSADTTYVLEIIACDIQGNSKYDNSVIWNGIDIGPEPFIDRNSNSVWDEGEYYFDIGMIDPTPASMKFPIKNSSPEVEWNKESIIPDVTFPVITVGWDATDLDGDESIVSIDLAINDINLAVNLPGNTRLVTLRIKDVNAVQPELQILINGSEDKIFEKTLTGIKLDDFNRLYVRATDISGSTSEIQSLPDTSRTWFIKKPKGDILIVDDYAGGADAISFYNNLFSSIDNGSYINKYDVMDIEATKLPFANITFLETLKLFKYIYWYSDASPSLELASSITQKYIVSGGKIGYSMTLQEPTVAYTYDLATVQSFLPIEGFGEAKALNFMFPGALANPITDSTGTIYGYPQLKTATTISYVRTYVPSPYSAKAIHMLSSSQISGTISLITNDKKIFFIGIPLHQSNGIEGSVKALIEKVFIDEFGM
ncbi:MAG: hypothetical protein KKF62_04200 [Bacteroidetes bacterium]|nr:hypothetical protein [Bacteroidota bacterium]MBU1116354.1 hypothetical protein [Bacteroidota bacterium]MBU1800378.1 hypothetical protein [Bacteroidota bacterium]